jgi:hypothetical protein
MSEDLAALQASLGLETARLRSELGELNRLSENFGMTISRSFASAIIDGRTLSEVLRTLMLSLSRQALSAALKPLTELALGGVGGAQPLAARSAARAVSPAETQGAPMSVTVNIHTPDVEGFRRSQSEIAAAIARAAIRGQRNL